MNLLTITTFLYPCLCLLPRSSGVLFLDHQNHKYTYPHRIRNFCLCISQFVKIYIHDLPPTLPTFLRYHVPNDVIQRNCGAVQKKSAYFSVRCIFQNRSVKNATKDMFDFHRSDRGSNPGLGGKIS